MTTRRDFIVTANGFLLATTAFIVCPNGFLLACSPVPQFIVPTPSAVSQSVTNVIGINLPVGGAAALEYMGLPLFQNGIHSSRGFQDAATITNYIAVDANGWPTTDFGIYVTAFGGTSPSWVNVNSTPLWACGFVSKNGGLETIAGNGSIISNIVINGNFVTFDVQPTSGNFGFKVTGTTGGVTNVFAMLPAYRGNAPTVSNQTPSGIFGPGTFEFTTEAINEYKNYRHIRIMEFLDVLVNTASNTSATKFTWSNFQCKQHPSSANLEVFPQVWGIDLANACGVGLWTNMPAVDDGTYLGASAAELATITPGKPCYVEFQNEIWNGTVASVKFYDLCAQYITANPGVLDYDSSCTVSGSISGGSLNTINVAAVPATFVNTHHISGPNIPNNTTIQSQTGTTIVLSQNATGAVASGTFGCETFTTQHRYLSVRINTVAQQFSSTFGSRFGTDVKIVGAWQTGGNGASAIQDTLYFLNRQYGAPKNFVHSWAIAPYYNRDNTSVPGDGVNYKGNSDSVALIEAELSRKVPYQGYFSRNETIAVDAMKWGIELISYEGAWDSVAGESAAANIGATIEDNGYATVEQSYYGYMFNSGMRVFTRFEGGVQTGGGSLGANFTLTNNYSTAINRTAPRQLAMSPYFTGIGALTRNIVSGSGSTVQCINYVDNVTALSSTAANFNQNQFAAYVAPYNGTVASSGGTVGYLINCSTPGTYSLSVNFTTTAGSWATNVEIGAPGHPGTIVATNVTIPPSITDTPVALGNVTLYQGPNYLCLGIPNTKQSGVTLGTQMTFT